MIEVAATKSRNPPRFLIPLYVVRVRNVAIFALAESGACFFGFRSDDWFIERRHGPVSVLQLEYGGHSEHAEIIELELDCSPALRENPVR